MKTFYPILAGATLRDRAVACVGALIGIAVTGLITRALLGGDTSLALLLTAPIGASAVLLFAVPASPMAQPWPIVGGNVIAALSGVTVAHLIPEPMIAAGVSVGVAIAAMSLGRCLHPPGGGTALVAALGGPALASHGLGFALLPVGLNAVILVAVGWAFHRVSGHGWPHFAPAPAPTDSPPIAADITEADMAAALKTFGEPLDIRRDDLRALANLAAAEARARQANRTSP